MFIITVSLILYYTKGPIHDLFGAMSLIRKLHLYMILFLWEKYTGFKALVFKSFY